MGAVLNPPTAAAAGSALNGYLHWACDLEWAQLPAPTRRNTALVLADNLAAVFSALEEPQVAQFQARLQARATADGRASLLHPQRPRLSVAQAAQGNALAMGWNELDEGYRKAVCHAGLYVLPALLAEAEAQDASLQELLRALALGYETAARFASCWRFPALKIHPHALFAPVGAAAGVGFLRRLPAAELLSALGSAATLGMAGPFTHALEGVLARNVWPAQAALAGLNALEWAACGIGGVATSPQDVYVGALGGSADLSVLEAGLPNGWAVDSGYHKLHACCQYAHSTIEAVQSLLHEHPQLRGGEAVVSIEVEIHPLGLALATQQPATTLAAKFSVPHAVAAALVHGDGGVAAFAASALADSQIARLRQVTRLLPFVGLRAAPEDRPARVRLLLADGSRLEAVCWSARGGPDRPFTEAELWAKVDSLSRSAAPAYPRAMRQMVEAAGGPPEQAELRGSWRDWLNAGLAGTASFGA